MDQASKEENTNTNDGDSPSSETSGLQRKQLHVRDLQKRDFQILSHLVKDYPHFSQLDEGGRLDRIVLVLQSACGFGAVRVETIEQALNHLSLSFQLDVIRHFEESQYTAGSSGESHSRYKQPYENAYRLDREYANTLANEGEDKSDSEEPIRKKVKGKQRPPKPVASRQVVKAKPRSEQALKTDKITSPAKETSVANKETTNEIESNWLKQHQWKVLAAAMTLVLMAALLFLVGQA